MTEHFTREESDKFARQYGLPVGIGCPNWHHIVNTTFAAKLKEWEAQGAVAKAVVLTTGIGLQWIGEALPAGTKLFTHALPAQPAEPAKDAGLVADGWQPIETAPKDGTMFLAYVSAVKYKENDDGSITEFDVSEIDFCQWTSIAHTEGASPSDGYWDNMMSQIGDSYGVTHWMPLPASLKIGGV